MPRHSLTAPAVTSKSQNYDLWQRGAYGNKLRAWRSLDEWEASGFSGLVALRELGAGGGLCRYDLGPERVRSLALEWAAYGVPLDRIMVNEMAPSDALLLQGEYLNDVYVQGGEVRWGYFRHSWVREPMRAALAANQKVVSGLRADLLIRGAMTPSSHEDWEELIERYPGHVLELSIYESCLGDVPGRNALVWEVRRY